jgi:galactose mutarotase-like enzyme
MNQTIHSGSVKAVIKSKGAELSSLTDETGTQYLWQGDPTYWKSQSPVLFPIVGSLRNKTARTANGGTCRMERHGAVRKREFTLTAGTESSAEFTIRSSEETRREFPYDFEFRVKYSLSGKTLTYAMTAVNRDRDVMPYFVGAHPAFRCPLLDGEKFEDYEVEFADKEFAACPRALLDGLVDVNHRQVVLNNEKVFHLDRAWFAYDCQIFDQLRSRSAALRNPATGRGARLDFPGFDYFIVWTSKNGGPFLALEPWTGISTCTDEDDTFEHKRGVKFLAPGEARTHSFTITLL